MSFTPILPASGLLGYRLLTQTEDSQRAIFETQPEISRDIEYFNKHIGAVETAEDLVSDRRLLRVALGAFGLDEEIDKRAFIRKVLEEGSEDPEAFANRFTDPRYKEIAAAFGFGDTLGARTFEPGFGARITAAYKDRQFEIAVGGQDEALRLALNFRREIKDYADADDPEGTAWFSVMGEKPLRAVFEGAFGLSEAFGQLDIDRQRDELRQYNETVFGSKSLEVFQDDEIVEKAISRFLIRRSIEDGPSAATPGYAALTLLGGGGGVGSTGLANLILSSTL
ncbi:DUF1217 domain-containing protein [Pikeienuella piscinae]|uniref:DUF1217 domain-containing protein n=1 Tax=Pikeienuella piscinae TaxID=2748098 RepID=A0A7L5C4V0_9RHOB|nr:DUF1217 domain-containing protein [Pikeienuella piscinae]QIE56979.1 DUF1217 domain-containing protein [Pikeienuella piscinae]